MRVNFAKKIFGLTSYSWSIRYHLQELTKPGTMVEQREEEEAWCKSEVSGHNWGRKPWGDWPQIWKSNILFHILPGPNPNPSSKTRGVCIQAYFTSEHNLHHGYHKQIERSQRQSIVHLSLYCTRKWEWQRDNSVWIHNSHNRFITVRQCRWLFASKAYYDKHSLT